MDIGVSEIISLIALLVSIAVIFRTWKIDKELKSYELKFYREKERESKKALLDAKIFKGETWSEIQVYNKGSATARNIRVLFDDDIENNGLFIVDNKLHHPFPFLHNGDSFGLKFVLAQEHKWTQEITFVWDDDFSMNQERKYVLCF